MAPLTKEPSSVILPPLTSALLSLSSTIHSLPSQLLRLPSRPPIIAGHGVIVITTSCTSSLSRSLALRFAGMGWTVFVQTDPERGDDMGHLIKAWQGFKRTLTRPGEDELEYADDESDDDYMQDAQTKPGSSSSASASARYTPGRSYTTPSTPSHSPPSTSASSPSPSRRPSRAEWNPAIIPLPFSSRDSTARAEAAGTVDAWCREHGHRNVVALINCVEPSAGPQQFGRRRISVGSSTEKEKEKEREKLKQVGGKTYYREIPIPLAIATDEHLLAIHATTFLCPLGMTQDFLPLLRKSKGRVINVWSRTSFVPMGPTRAAEAAFKAATRTLDDELRPLGVRVSLVLPAPRSWSAKEGPGKSEKGAEVVEEEKWKEIMPTISVTNDVRSILTPSSSPTLRSLFTTQVETYQRLVLSPSSIFSLPPEESDSQLFNVVRHAVGDKWPRAVYPVGLDAVIGQWVEWAGVDGEAEWVRAGREKWEGWYRRHRGTVRKDDSRITTAILLSLHLAWTVFCAWMAVVTIGVVRIGPLANGSRGDSRRNARAVE